MHPENEDELQGNELGLEQRFLASEAHHFELMLTISFLQRNLIAWGSKHCSPQFLQHCGFCGHCLMKRHPHCHGLDFTSSFYQENSLKARWPFKQQQRLTDRHLMCMFS